MDLDFFILVNVWIDWCMLYINYIWLVGNGLCLLRFYCVMIVDLEYDKIIYIDIDILKYFYYGINLIL